MNGFILLTRAGDDGNADLRINVRHIVYFHPNETGAGAVVVTTEATADGNALWYVADACEEIDAQIDALIGGAS